MNLKHLQDNILISETKRIARKERDVTAEILHYLKEIDRRKLYSDYGHSSLISFAVKELNYSEGSACRRIAAARMLADIPEIDEKINDGTLSLTTISLASSFFRKEEIKDPNAKKGVLKELEGKTTRECEKTLLELFPDQAILPKEEVRVVTPEFHQLRVNVTSETLKLLEETRALAGEWTYSDLFFKKMATEAIQNIRRRKFKFTDTVRKSGQSSTRYVARRTKREVAIQSNYACENCGSIFMLQFDHCNPYALGGKSSKENIRLLCFNCNQRARIRAKL